MFRDACQRGMLSIFFSKGSKPFLIWDIVARDGYVTTFLDPDIKVMVAELRGNNVTTTYMVCPKGNQVLGIQMPLLVMVVKNLHKYFSFEVTIKDESGTRRRFRVSNFQSSTQILPLCTVMPLSLSKGWNQIQFNLAEFCRRAYQKQFVEVQNVKVNCNIRIRRIYFTEKLMTEDELPADYKIFFPLASKGPKLKIKPEDKEKENVIPTGVAKAQSVTTKKSEAKGMVDKGVVTDPAPAAAVPAPAPDAPPAAPQTAEETPTAETPATEEIKVEGAEGEEQPKQEEAAPVEGEPKTETEAEVTEGAPPTTEASEAPASEQPTTEPSTVATDQSKEPEEAPAPAAEA